MLWAVGGAVLIVLGLAIALDVRGLGGALWRLWESSYRRRGFKVWGSPLFVRSWFAGLLVVIGGCWVLLGTR